MSKEEMCDCGHKKARLVYACTDCVPTANFPKGVRRAKKLKDNQEGLEKSEKEVEG